MALETDLQAEFLHLLEQDAGFRGEVRRRLLTAELLELPERFAAFAARVDGFIDAQQTVNTRVDERLDGIDKRFDGIDRRFDSIDRRFDRIDKRFDGIDKKMQNIMDDLSVLKGHAPSRAARDHVETILDELGLTYITILHQRDLVKMLAKASDIATGDRQSFFRAAVVLEAEASDGTIHYVAVEASYTADRRDSDRALRNAGYLTRITGCPAHAVVASLRNDLDVQGLVDEGAVQWHRLTEKDLDPE